MDGQRALDARTTGFATVVELDADAGARPADALPEVMSRLPGASVRSLGGLGQFASISVRGSSAQQVQVFIEGVPVTGSAAGLSSLGDLPLDALERVVLYRGLVPLGLGGATIGGAVDLVGASGAGDAEGGPTAGVHTGLGAFGAREALGYVRARLGERPLLLTARVGYAGATGNFPFFDTNGTPQLTDDDRRTRRRNNDYDRVQTQLRLDGGRASRPWHVQQLVTWKEQGIPGPATAQSSATRLGSVAARTIAGLRHRSGLGPGGELHWRFGLGVERRIFRDPRGEVGVGIDDQRTDTVDLFVAPTIRVPVWRGAWFTAVADHRSEWVSVGQRAPTEGLPTTGDADRGRFAFGVGVGLEQQLFGARWILSPGVRVDAFDSRFGVAAGEGERNDGGRDRLDLGVSPRLGTRVVLAPGLDLRASVGRYFRVPTLRELFGDQGWFLGNEGLGPELGTSVDGGLVLDRPLEKIGGAAYGHLAGFGSFSENTITWVQTGPVVQPRNIGGALSAGVETGGQIDAWFRRIRIAGNYTFNHTAARSLESAEDGQPLPGRPRHEAYLRPSFGWRFEGSRAGAASFRVEPRAYYTLDFASQTFLDPSGRFSLPPRVFHGVGLGLDLDGQVHVGAELRNLTDQIRTEWTPATGGGALPYPVVDFINYPLPGRSLWVSVRITPNFEGQRRR